MKSAMKRRQELTLKPRQELTLRKLREAARVKYKKTSVKVIDGIKTSFLWQKKRDFKTFQKLRPRARFLCYYIWRAYFQMLPWRSFIDFLEEVAESRKIKHITRTKKHSVHGGLFGLAISGIVAGIAAAAAKAGTAAAATAAAIGTSTAAKAVAIGVGGALASAATEAAIKKITQ